MSAAWFQGVIATGVDEKGDVRADLLHVLRLPDFDRAERIGEFWGHPETRSFGELLIDLGGGQGGAGGRVRAPRGDGARVAVAVREPVF